MVNNNDINYFFTGLNQRNDKKLSAEATQQLQRDFRGVFSGIGCFDGTFLLKVKTHSKPYQAFPRCVAYALEKPSKWS